MDWSHHGFTERWTATKDMSGTIGVVTFDHADNKRFWDWYYEDYDKPDKCDYTLNCHGFAFDVGDRPDDAVTIIGAGAAPVEGVVPPPCWVGAEKKDIKVAADPPSHSIKVTRSLWSFYLSKTEAQYVTRYMSARLQFVI